MDRNIFVLIPAFNEEQSIGKVIADIPDGLVSETIVVSNNSTDDTEKVARDAGATVLTESKQGYGHACLKGMEYVRQMNGEAGRGIVVFMDGDYSDYPEEIEKLIRPIVEEEYDMVIGSRALGKKEKGALAPQQVFGNWLATKLLRVLYGGRFTDLGPFRAIRFNRLLELDMQDKTYGWTVEMQVKAVKQRLKYCEVPVNYKKRIGVSKVSGTIKGSVMAGYKIIATIFRYL